jgi:predicted transcriptional regulator
VDLKSTITRKELAERLEVGMDTVKEYLGKLKHKGILMRIGNNREVTIGKELNRVIEKNLIHKNNFSRKKEAKSFFETLLRPCLPATHRHIGKQFILQKKS